MTYNQKNAIINKNNMLQELFTQLGLSKNEAIIYEYLLKKGESSALDIEKNTPLKKGVVYAALNNLDAKGLISEKMLAPKNPNVRNKKKIAYFNPEHPEKLKDFLGEQESKLQKSKKDLEANLSDIISSFNLVSGKPGIQFFEGMDGIKKVLEDSLNSKTTIRTYADIEAIVKYIDKINQQYVKKRDELGIKKRAIIIDSPFARKYLKNYHEQTTDIKFIDHKLFPFQSVMQIYDGKISYITLSEKSMIGVIIQDPAIYQMNRSIFEYTWTTAKKLS